MRFIAVSDPFKLGLAVDTLICLKVDAASVMRVAEQLAEMREVRYAGVTSGAYDIHAAALFHDTGELLEFVTRRLASLEGVVRVETSHVLCVLKRTYDHWAEPHWGG